MNNIQGNPGDKLKTNHVCLFLLHNPQPAELLKLSPTTNKTPNCDKMKVAIVFVLLFATVLCKPVRKVSISSSESSEEVGKQPAPALRKQAVVTSEATSQNIVAAAAASSDESTDSDEDEATTSDSTASSSDTASVDSKDEDDDDDDSEETDEDESSDSSESGESSSPTPATATDTPVIVTEGPATDSTPEPIEPTIVTDTDTARGDNFGSYPSEYKSIYVEDKSYHKVPSPYKSYEFVGTGKKMAYDMTYGNEVEKSLQVYKALQVHSDVLEEDTSTPEVESQGLDTSYGTSQDEDISPRQASVPEEESVSTSDATTSESTSAPEEEEESESNTSESDSQDSEDEDSQSSEEATATPGAADSDSDESDSTETDSDEEGAGPDTTTDMPVVITAK